MGRIQFEYFYRVSVHAIVYIIRRNCYVYCYLKKIRKYKIKIPTLGLYIANIFSSLLMREMHTVAISRFRYVVQTLEVDHNV